MVRRGGLLRGATVMEKTGPLSTKQSSKRDFEMANIESVRSSMTKLELGVDKELNTKNSKVATARKRSNSDFSDCDEDGLQMLLKVSTPVLGRPLLMFIDPYEYPETKSTSQPNVEISFNFELLPDIPSSTRVVSIKRMRLHSRATGSSNRRLSALTTPSSPLTQSSWSVIASEDDIECEEHQIKNDSEDLS